MKYETCMCIIGIFVFVSLLEASVTSAKDYSVTAGDWKVSFNTSTPVSTNVEWKELNGLKDNGYFLIWINASYQVSGIALFEQPEGVRVPVARNDLEGYLSSETPKELLGLPVNDFKIDGKGGLITHGWYNELATTAYVASYPVDPTPDNTATTVVQYLSFIGEKPSMEIINSLHAEYSGTQASSPQPTQPTPSASYTPQATGTRDDLVPIGTTIDLGDGWQIRVLQVYPDATNMVLRENQFNKAPKPGDQFFLATVAAKYVGDGSAKFDGSYRLRAVGPSSVGYSTFENDPGVIPNPLPSSEVFSGGVIFGNVGWEISSSDASALVMYDSPISSFGSSNGRIYMALFGQGG